MRMLTLFFVVATYAMAAPTPFTAPVEVWLYNPVFKSPATKETQNGDRNEKFGPINVSLKGCEEVSGVKNIWFKKDQIESSDAYYSAKCERISSSLPGNIGNAKIDVRTTKTVLITVPDQIILKMSIQKGRPELTYKNRAEIVKHFDDQIDPLITPKTFEDATSTEHNLKGLQGAIVDGILSLFKGALVGKFKDQMRAELKRDVFLDRMLEDLVKSVPPVPNFEKGSMRIALTKHRKDWGALWRIVTPGVDGLSSTLENEVMKKNPADNTGSIVVHQMAMRQLIGGREYSFTAQNDDQRNNIRRFFGLASSLNVDQMKISFPEYSEKGPHATLIWKKGDVQMLDITASAKFGEVTSPINLRFTLAANGAVRLAGVSTARNQAEPAERVAAALRNTFQTWLLSTFVNARLADPSWSEAETPDGTIRLQGFRYLGTSDERAPESGGTVPELLILDFRVVRPSGS